MQLLFDEGELDLNQGDQVQARCDEDGNLKVAGTFTNPSGAATSAKQDTIIGHVDGIETALTAANASLDAIEAVPPMTSAQFLANLRSTATHSSVASAASSTTILASNANRKGARIFNTDANALYLDLSGGTAVAASRAQVRLATDEGYDVPFGCTGLITGIWAADGAGVASVVEFA